MLSLVFASHNRNKVREIASLLDRSFELLNLDDILLHEDIPENENTFAGNAKAKVLYVLERRRVNCFADDSGLEVEVLNGEPGVFSARYAGEQKDDEANLNLLLTKMKGLTNRTARFKTAIVLFVEGAYHLFEGEVKGEITTEKRGGKGFGYDPVFVPEGSDKTFAEMSMEEKNGFSHRAKALEQMISFLKKYENKN